MATRPTLPYYAPADTLPGPLPTVAEIIACTREVVFNNPHVVLMPGDHYVVKFGKNVPLQEGENMLFVQQSTSIPVPTVYALFHDEETDMNFIIQEYLSGKTLSYLWKTFDDATKESLMAQLRRHLDELRSLPSPGYYGGIWGQDAREFYVSGGPFKAAQKPDLRSPRVSIKQLKTEKEWVDAMLASARLNCSLTEESLAYITRMFHGAFTGYGPSVFTHGDLDWGNIQVRPDGTIAILDWEYAGWYPRYWEASINALVISIALGRSRWIPYYLDEYPAVVGWLTLYRIWLLRDHRVNLRSDE